MKVTPIFLATLLFCACANKPFLKHKLDYKKISENCSGLDPKFKMNSNLNGERYEFERCLDNAFAGKDYVVERKGDTVMISFTKTASNVKAALYNITLDVDTYPRYNFMTIDDNTFRIVPAGN